MTTKPGLNLSSQNTIAPVIGGLIFVAIFLLRYAGIDPSLYEIRDDGVITMSVARNLVDFGFVGVSPSGPIVEASSSPVQMLLYAAIYAATGAPYGTFAHAQTVVASFLLGCVFALVFPPSRIAGILTQIFLALGLSFIFPFFLWHGSGMENAVTHVLLLSCVVGMMQMVRNQQVAYFWIIPVILACFVRLELIVTVWALLGLFTLYWYFEYKRFDGLWFSMFVILACVIGHGLRIYYFGSFFPNTAVAQSISVGDRLGEILSGSVQPILEGLWIARHNFLNGGWWIAIVSLPFAVLLIEKSEHRFMLLAVLAIMSVAMFTPALLGRPRIDWGRTYSHVAPIAFLLPAFCLFQAVRSKTTIGIVGAFVVIVASFVGLSGNKPYYLGWKIDDFDTTRQEFVALAERHDIQRPLIANPDLGIMSWHKEHNILDLGMLGSPIIAGLQGNAAIADFILDLAQPDFVESHGYWTNVYCEHLFLDARFDELYRPVTEATAVDPVCGDISSGKTLWVRRTIEQGASTPERAFLDRLQGNLDAALIEAEISECAATDGSCRYIARTVFRFIPELSKAGSFEDVAMLFNAEIERDYLMGWQDVDAPRRVVSAFLR
jgi:hypothetical protein